MTPAALRLTMLTVLILALIGAASADEWRDQIEADWARQEAVRSLTTGVTTQGDAAGACDGVKNGKWGFHTLQEPDPWWQVDLGEIQEVGRVVVYNRCDATASRSASLILSLSPDGVEWEQAYQHNGETFWGFTGGPPLTVDLAGAKTRYLRIQLPGTVYLHFDEVEVYAPDSDTNIALRRPADQSSISQWSVQSIRPGAGGPSGSSIERIIDRGLKLAEAVQAAGGDSDSAVKTLQSLLQRVGDLPSDAADATCQALYVEARNAVRQLALSSPLMDFDSLLFAKRSPGVYSHMSDQYYGWWSRPGGGLYLLEGLRSDTPQTQCLTEGMEEGNFLRPDLSHDGKRVIFAYCRYYPDTATRPNKVDRAAMPEDAFYHIYEMNVDGTDLRQLTSGRYNDFDARYLPSGDIVFLSTRRGQFVQYAQSIASTTMKGLMPDSFVRCGGGASRPVAVYTLHVMDAAGASMRAISAFENFEWTPSVSADGRVLYARWDYVDRHNNAYMSLWSTNPDGTNSRIVYGNFTRSPHSIFEARSVPNSRKLMFTASAHHSITAGSVLLDPSQGVDGPEPLTRLTPEVCFPETEGWPQTYFANPYPLSEWQYLAAWSDLPLATEGRPNPPNALGIYLCDAFGNLELLHRDPEISSMYPIPLRSRVAPPTLADRVTDDPAGVGDFLLMDVYRGLTGVERGDVARLRVIGVPPKVQPQMNSPSLGVTDEDPGKVVLGTVPVEADGSAHFSVPAGLSVFFQALDDEGMALQTMRTITYVQPGETLTCIGCHETRHDAPANIATTAGARPPPSSRSRRRARGHCALTPWSSRCSTATVSPATTPVRTSRIYPARRRMPACWPTVSPQYGSR